MVRVLLNKIEFYESEELEDKDVKLFEGIIYQQNKNSFADYSAECIYPFQNISSKITWIMWKSI